MSDIVLEVNNLVKEYGRFRAVDGISFTVPKGKVVGLLGPNGAGKTTTIQVLLGITLHNAGTIKYFGKDFTKHRQICLQRINFVSSFNTLQGRITSWENLVAFSYLYNVKNYKKKIMDLIKYFGAEDLLHKRYWDLSTGQKTRINIIKSLVNDPELILMDEPTASLDPDIADKTLTLIESLVKERNLSMLFTSHDMSEVSRICHEVIFLDHGKIVAQDAPLSLTKRITNTQLKLIFDNTRRDVEEFLKDKEYSYEFLNPKTVIINTEEKMIPKIIFSISKAGIWLIDIEVKKPTLEDVFLQIARGETNVNT